MEIQNIHAVRSSADALQALCEEQSDQKWYSKLEATGWMNHVQTILSAANSLARKMEVQKLSCIVHCSDGWDRTAQLTSLCQILLDPYYRTIGGFQSLIDKEWISFGHMFRQRTYSMESSVERAPVFLLFLDCTYQLLHQHPEEFEFTEDLLIMLADHYQSGWFGNFLMDCEKEFRMSKVARKTTSLWSHVNAVRPKFLNREFRHRKNVIYPNSSMKRLVFWTGYFLRHEQKIIDSCADPLEMQDEDHNTVVWVPDADVRSCKDCGLKFTSFRRRHHCRACGHVFCRDCSRYKMALPSFGYSTEERVCDHCYVKLKVENTLYRAM
eukprot:m.171163 g.171163  ORF g.171163 m.171163 type:complete len:325 (+) comp15347_c0_seq3:2812-3786(+)